MLYFGLDKKLCAKKKKKNGVYNIACMKRMTNVVVIINFYKIILNKLELYQCVYVCRGNYNI